MAERSSGLPAETIASLIRTAVQEYQQGDQGVARSLIRALTARQPDNPQVWLTLAKIAETRDEQRRALERVIAIDPQHPLAQSSLARFKQLSGQTVVPPIRPTLPPEYVAPEPEEETAVAESQIRWPLYVVLGVSVLIVLIAFVLLRPSDSATGQPNPALPGAISTGSTSASATPPLLSPGAGAPDPTAAPGAGDVEPTQPPVDAASPTTVEASAVPTPIPTATAPVVPTPATQLAVGQLVSEGDWTASLLRPDYAIALDGSIGALQPQGRFVLALMSVANTNAAAARMPTDLFVLVDEQGRSYRAIPNASTAYLEAYGRGQRGDFSMEDDIPGSGRTWSVPVMFDVPTTTRAFTLLFGNTSAGWPIALPAPQPTASAG